MSRARFGLFVEGAHDPLPRERDDLRELWYSLCDKNGIDPGRVDVHGFSKAQIVAMASPAARTAQGEVRYSSRRPLDAAIAVEYDLSRFDVLMVAFDAHPPNQELLSSGCMRREIDFVLERFAESSVLPDQFRAEARRLRVHYGQNPRHPRGPGRPPRGPVEILYMDPKFEALILTDVAAWRDVFGLGRTPKDWPSLPPRHTQLEGCLERIVSLGRSHGKAPRHVHGDAKSAKHAWAAEVVRRAKTNSPMWKHSIAIRLGEIFG
jgi:hypothetical protein